MNIEQRLDVTFTISNYTANKHNLQTNVCGLLKSYTKQVHSKLFVSICSVPKPVESKYFQCTKETFKSRKKYKVLIGQ